MPFTIVRQDITRMHVDAIVNAANTELRMGGGVCGAIFQAAGASVLQAACAKAAPIPTGGAALTPGFNLPAKYIIHAAGPVYSPQNAAQSERLLRSAYLESLRLALRHRCVSIAFPLISSGIYGYPKEDALRVATAAIGDFLMQHDMDVYLAIFDKASFVISRKLAGAVESYIDENYVFSHQMLRRGLLEVEREALEAAAPLPMAASSGIPGELDRLMDNLDEPFHVALLKLIDAKGKTDVEVYKRANIDRKLFSKIRKGKGYLPGKRTVLALAIALQLTLRETDELLERAGYALSHSQKFDVIVEYFIVSGQYDIFRINEVLFQYDLPLLGSN
ncbi:MAG TPA: macro domain-containing protein [Candidatus Limiplasma pullicola]|nr:macro domain-containing protein [Candidatus Limiplasma pullicola]